MDSGGGHQSLLRSRIVIPSLETQLLELARSKLPELGQGFGSVREQEELPCRVESYLDCTVVNTVIDPVDREPEFAGDLGHGETAPEFAAGATDAAR